MARDKYVLFTDHRFTGIKILDVAKVEKQTEKLIYLDGDDWDFYTSKRRVRMGDVELELCNRDKAKTLKSLVKTAYNEYREKIERAQIELGEAQEKIKQYITQN